MTIHKLKIWPDFFEAVTDGRKRFEIRKDDRTGFEVGDHLVLQEWKPLKVDDHTTIHALGNYTGREVTVKVTYVLSGSPVLKTKYVALGIERLDERPEALKA